MIPKIIHYCWFGGKTKPKLIKDCIASWKQHLSNYQIIEWNEKNTDLSHPFIIEAYSQKKWAFVSDFVRLSKIEEFGGIYLDTDMMVIKNLDCFLEQDCFFGAEDLEYISCGIIGAIPHNPFIQSCIEKYDFLRFEKVKEITIPRIVTARFRNLYFFDDDFCSEVIRNGVKIYPSNYFYPFPLESKRDLKNYKNYIQEATYAVHLWSSSWIDHSEFHYFRNKKYATGFYQMISHLFKTKEFKYSYFRKIASSIKESLSY